jgi:hypothetical protein
MRINTRSVLLFCATMAGAFSACADAPDPQETAHKRCLALRDHLIDLRLSGAEQSVDVAAHREAMKQALGETFIETCQQQVSADEASCELSATDLEAASACRK